MFNRHSIYFFSIIIFTSFSGHFLHAAKGTPSNNYHEVFIRIKRNNKLSVQKKIHALDSLLDDLMGNQSIEHAARGTLFNELSTKLRKLIAKRRANTKGSDGAINATLDMLVSKIDAYQMTLDQQLGRNGTSFSRIKKIFFDKKTWYVVGGVALGLVVLAAAVQTSRDAADDDSSSSDESAFSRDPLVPNGPDSFGGIDGLSSKLPDPAPPGQSSYSHRSNSDQSLSSNSVPAGGRSYQRLSFRADPLPMPVHAEEPEADNANNRTYSPPPQMPTTARVSFTEPTPSILPVFTRPISPVPRFNSSIPQRPPLPTRASPPRPTASTPAKPAVHSFTSTQDSAEAKRKAEAEREAREKNAALDKFVRSEGYRGFMAWKKENVCYDNEIKDSGNTYYAHTFATLKTRLGVKIGIYHSSREDFEKFTPEELVEIEGYMKTLSDARKEIARARKEKEETDKRLKREQTEEKQRKADEQKKDIASFIADQRSTNFAAWANSSLEKDRLWFTEAEGTQLSEIEDILRVKACTKPEAMIASLLASPSRVSEFIGSDVRLLRLMSSLLKIQDAIPGRRDKAVKIKQLLERDVVKDFFAEAQRRSYNSQNFESEIDKSSKKACTRLRVHLSDMNETALRDVLEKNIGLIGEIISIFDDMTKYFDSMREMRRKNDEELSEAYRRSDT